MSTFLVTGAAGFIGSALVRGLLREGHTVRGFDNFSTGKRENLEECLAHIELLEADLADREALLDACRGVEFVLHHAALASVPRSLADPETAHRINAEGTLNLLVAAREAGVQRVVYAGSSAVYGDSPILPKREDLEPEPLSPYAASKLAGERHMADFWNESGLETVTLRYFNVFGARQHAASPYSGVLARFITQMLEGETPTIFGDGGQSRDFVHVDDVVRANLLACRAPAGMAAGQVFNIASGRSASLTQVFDMLKRLTGYAGAPQYAPARPGDIRHSAADIRRAESRLGFRPQVSLEEGLARTVEWYCQQRAKPRAAPTR